MKKLFLGLAMVLSVLAAGGKAEARPYTNVAGITQDVTDVTYEVTYNYDEAYKLANKISEERVKLGKEPLIVNEGLMRAAMDKAAILNWEFDHVPAAVDGILVGGRFYGGNEIITTSGEAEEAYLNFYNSTGHKAVMLYEEATYIGVGVVNGYTCVKLSSKNAIEHPVQASYAGSYDTPDIPLIGTTLTNYTELYTVHVYTNRMTPEKWLECIGKMTYNDCNQFNITEANKLSLGDTIALTGSHSSYTLYVEELNRDVPSQIGISQHAFSYSVSDSSVLKLEGTTLTAVGEGTATLTMTLKGTNYSKNVTIEVTGPEKKETKSVKLTKVSNLKLKRYKVKGHKTMLYVSWKGIKGVDSYNVQVAKDKKFKKLLVNKKYTGFTSTGITKNLKGKKVYVRVRAIKGKKSGSWSKVRTIKTYK